MVQALLVEKEGRITNVVTMSVERCRAIEDPARAAILHILSHKPMSTEGLARELRRNGHSRATTTIRHHMEVLRDCGLVEVVRLREVRGAVERYYAPTVKFLGFEDSFSVEGCNALISETSKKLLKIMVSIAERYAKTMTKKNKNASSDSCRYCSSNHGREYILFEIINRAIADASQSQEFLAVQKLLEPERQQQQEGRTGGTMNYPPASRLTTREGNGNGRPKSYARLHNSSSNSSRSKSDRSKERKRSRRT